MVYVGASVTLGPMAQDQDPLRFGISWFLDDIMVKSRGNGGAYA